MEMFIPGLSGHQSYSVRCSLPLGLLIVFNSLLTRNILGICPALPQSLNVKHPPLDPTEVFGELSSSLGIQLRGGVAGVKHLMPYVVSWLLTASPGKDSCVCSGIKMEGLPCSPFRCLREAGTRKENPAHNKPQHPQECAGHCVSTRLPASDLTDDPQKVLPAPTQAEDVFVESFLQDK